MISDAMGGGIVVWNMDERGEFVIYMRKSRVKRRIDAQSRRLPTKERHDEQEQSLVVTN